MKVTPSDQLDLLELQNSDLRLSQLQHAIETHALRIKLEELGGRAADLSRSIITQETDLEDRRRRIKDLEKQISEVVARQKLQQERLDTGKVPMRDMSAVEHEIRQIVARKDDLEYELLEAQEALEKREEFLVETLQARQAIEADEEKTEKELEEALVEPNAELETLRARRLELRDSLPEAVLDEYDYYRSRMGELVVLAYEGGMLKDAPMGLSGAEESALRSSPEDVLWQSEESDYFVVRL